MKMYLTRESRGLGLTQRELVFKTTTVGLNSYLEQQWIPFSDLCTSMKITRSFIQLQKTLEISRENSRYQTYLENGKSKLLYLLREYSRRQRRRLMRR